MSIDDLRQIINDDTSIIAAKECVEKLKELKMNDVKGIKPGEKIIAKDLSIEAVHAYNTNKKFHPKSDDKVGYVISITNNLYISCWRYRSDPGNGIYKTRYRIRSCLRYLCNECGRSR